MNIKLEDIKGYWKAEWEGTTVGFTIIDPDDIPSPKSRLFIPADPGFYHYHWEARVELLPSDGNNIPIKLHDIFEDLNEKDKKASEYSKLSDLKIWAADNKHMTLELADGSKLDFVKIK